MGFWRSPTDSVAKDAACTPRRSSWDRRNPYFPASSAGALAGAGSAGGVGAARKPPPVKRSITERTASRVFWSLTASSSGAEACERRSRLSGSGNTSGSSQGPWITNGSSKPGVPAVVLELHRDGQTVIGRAAVAEIAGPGERLALQPLQQLLDVETGNRAVMAGQGRPAVERLHQAERA